jgi:hypothetical protein
MAPIPTIRLAGAKWSAAEAVLEPHPSSKAESVFSLENSKPWDQIIFAVIVKRKYFPASVKTHFHKLGFEIHAVAIYEL